MENAQQTYNPALGLNLALEIRRYYQAYSVALANNENEAVRDGAREFCKFVRLGGMFTLIRMFPTDLFTGVYESAHPDILEEQVSDMERRVSGNNRAAYVSQRPAIDVAGRLDAMEKNLELLASSFMELRKQKNGNG